MRLGSISLWGDDLEAFRRQLRLAEELGYDAIGIGESPSVWQDMCVTLALAAQETSRATLATTVTTPFLRHPAASSHPPSPSEPSKHKLRWRTEIRSLLAAS